MHLSPHQWDQLEDLKDLLERSFVLTKKMQLEDLTPGYFFRFDFYILHMLQFPHLCLQTRQMTVKVKEVDLPGAVSGEPWRHDCQRHSGVDEEEKGGALRPL